MHEHPVSSVFTHIGMPAGSNECLKFIFITTAWCTTRRMRNFLLDLPLKPKDGDFQFPLKPGMKSTSWPCSWQRDVYVMATTPADADF